MKEKIIVPVDFSRTSQNAYFYACEMAKEFDCSIEVVHSFVGVLADPESERVGEPYTIRENLNLQLDKFIQSYPIAEEEGGVTTQLKVTTKVLPGGAVPSIVSLSEERDVFMIVMGATGATNSIGQMFGGIASDVALKAKVPVLLVPEYAKFKPFGKILFASNFESADSSVVEELYQLANKFKSMVHFIHVNEKDEKTDFTEVEGKIFAQLWGDRIPTFPFEMKSVKSKSVLKGLNVFATQEDVDLIFVANRKRNMWNRILKESTTAQLAANIRKPILVHHLS